MDAPAQRAWSIVVFTGCVLVTGCSSDTATVETETNIAWISKGRCNTFFDVSRFGARLAAPDLEAEHGGTVEVEFLEPDDCSGEPDPAIFEGVSEECASAAPQLAVLRQAIDQRPDAIAITVVNPDCVAPLVDEAVDAGIQVITFDSDAPKSKRHTHYGMDNEESARVLVRNLAQQMGEEGEVAIQTSMVLDADGNYQLSASSSYVSRIDGITDELAKYPNMTLVATVPCMGGDVMDVSCSETLDGLLAEHPNLGGVVLARGKVLREVGLEDAAPNFAAKVKAGALHSVAFDAPDDAIDNIRAGYAELVIAQKQFGWGYDVVRLAYSMVNAKLEPPAFYDAGWYTVCPSNLDQYGEMWRDNDFRKDLSECQGIVD